MVNDKQVRKVARCIKTLLETEGVKISTTKVANFIKDKDLSDVNLLKVDVINDMRDSSSSTKSPRKQPIETFMISNWGLIKDNNEIKEVLLNAYCQGRYNKETREKMKIDVLSRCEPNEEFVNEMVEDITTELAGALLEEPKKYDF